MNNKNKITLAFIFTLSCFYQAIADVPDFFKSGGDLAYDPLEVWYQVAASGSEQEKSNQQRYISWDSREPSGNGSCVKLIAENNEKLARWDDDRCNSNARAACFNGYQWEVTRQNSNFANADARCRNNFGVNYKFAAPRNFPDSVIIANKALSQNANRVWLNIRKDGNEWVFNRDVDVVAPFWKSGEPNNDGDCAYVSADGLWNDGNCSSGRKLVCFDRNDQSWHLTSGSYPANDINLANLRCEQIAARYRFYAPFNIEESNALRAKLAGAEAWVNASDSSREDSWAINGGINNWNVVPDNSVNIGKRCVSANAATGFWQPETCNTSFKVACSTGISWQFTSTTTTLADFSDGQRLCDELAEANNESGYVFQAPKTPKQLASFTYFAQKKGASGKYWINGYRMNADQGYNLGSGQVANKWSWNSRQFTPPVWRNGQPDGSVGENCAVLTSSDWNDEACSQTHRYLCRNTATGTFQLSATSGNLSDFSSGAIACAATGANLVFAAPENFNENFEAKRVVGTNTVWINASDVAQEGTWLLNIANIVASSSGLLTNWLSGQPSNSPNAAGSSGADCAYQDQNGKWSDINCDATANASWACSDGYRWRVTKKQGKISQFADGHKACLSEFGSSFVFAAPLTKQNVLDLDAARKLTESNSTTTIDQVWLNLSDGGQEGEWRYNLPFVNWSGALYPAGVEPTANCILKGTSSFGENNPWIVTNCTSSFAHYACFSGADWQIALADGELVSGALQRNPRVGVDFWSYDRGNKRCKDQFGEQYYFSAPVTAAEELALDSAIRAIDSPAKNTWINYYYARNITIANKRWFADRLKLGIWQKPEFDNTSNSDCLALVKNTPTVASWTDERCALSKPFVCLENSTGDWKIIGNARWDKGFEVCQNNGAMFAAPRSPDELVKLLVELGSGGTAWINATDTAVESQWIVNRLRYAFWADQEPDNAGNKDCAKIDKHGQWSAHKCSLTHAPFVCRKINGNSIEWKITTAKGIWSQGFAFCKKEHPGSLFLPPASYGSTSTRVQQDALAAVVASSTQPLWINLSDQGIEGAWRPFENYADWGTESTLDEAKDCGYLDRSIKGKGTWFADACKYTVAANSARGFACTNGYEWKIVAATAATTKQQWSRGFDACDTLDSGNDDWYFAAPANAVDNAKLKLALELQNLDQVWMNVQDATSEGDWQINGVQTNFPIAIEIVAATQVAEDQASIKLRANLTDDEELAVASASWTLVESESDLAGFNAADFALSASTLTNTGAGTSTLTATYKTPKLLQKDVKLVFKVNTLDTSPGVNATAKTSSASVIVIVKSPLVAGYTFDDSAAFNKDISGNGHDAFNDQLNPLPPVENVALPGQNYNGAIRLNKTGNGSFMRVAGIATDASGGLVIPANAYTVAMRISIEEDFDDDGNTSSIRGVFQKGNTATERQPALFLRAGSDQLSARTSTSADNNKGVLTAASVATQQWINLIYVKDSAGIKLYVDGALTAQYDYTGGETPLGNNGDFWIGNIPGAPESFAGLVDDVQIYNRVLTATERGKVLPVPPVGQVSFTLPGSSVNEDAGSFPIKIERTRGYRGAFAATVQFDSTGNTVTIGTAGTNNTVITPAAADIALPNGTPATGLAINWADKEKGEKTLNVYLDTADDALREGTEQARLKIASATQAANNQPAIASPDVHLLALQDVTPNPYGNFSITGPADPVILENTASPVNICINRESGGQGDVTVNYTISGSAQRGTAITDDYQFVAGGSNIAPVANATTGSVVFSSNLAVSPGNPESKCFVIQVTNHPDVINELDRFVAINLDSITPADANSEALLTTNARAQITIRDYAPGIFSFKSASSACYEPSTKRQCSATVTTDCLPAVVFQGGFDPLAACEITVERKNAGFRNPAATVNIGYTVVVNNNNDFTAVNQLFWQENDAQEKKLTIDVVADDIQENLSETFNFSMSSPTVGSIDGTKNTHALTITDVTTPAVINIQAMTGSEVANPGDTSGSAPATVNAVAGSSFNITALRSGNPKTEFKLTRDLAVLDSAGQAVPATGAGCKPSDYIDFSSGSFNSASTTDNFDMDGGNKVWSVKTKNVFDLNKTYQVSLTLKDPCLKTGNCPGTAADSLNRVVGFGSNAAVGSVTSLERRFNVGELDSGAIPSNVPFAYAGVDLGTNEETRKAGQPNDFYAISKRTGKRSEVKVTATIPAISGLNTACALGSVYFQWVYLDSSNNEIDQASYDGATIKSGQRSGDIPLSVFTTAQTQELTIQLPYNADLNDTPVETRIRLKLYYGDSSGAYSSALVKKQDDIVIRTYPRWRRLKFYNTSRCVRWDPGGFLNPGNRYEALNCGTGGGAPDNELWTYDPINKLVINRGDQACATGLGDLGRTIFGSSAPGAVCTAADTKWTLETQGNDNDIRVQAIKNGDAEFWCRIGGFQQIESRTGKLGGGLCTGNDRNFRWGADQ